MLVRFLQKNISPLIFNDKKTALEDHIFFDVAIKPLFGNKELKLYKMEKIDYYNQKIILRPKVKTTNYTVKINNTTDAFIAIEQENKLHTIVFSVEDRRNKALVKVLKKTVYIDTSIPVVSFTNSNGSVFLKDAASFIDGTPRNAIKKNDISIDEAEGAGLKEIKAYWEKGVPTKIGQAIWCVVAEDNLGNKSDIYKHSVQISPELIIEECPSGFFSFSDIAAQEVKKQTFTLKADVSLKEAVLSLDKADYFQIAIIKISDNSILFSIENKESLQSGINTATVKIKIAEHEYSVFLISARQKADLFSVFANKILLNSLLYDFEQIPVNTEKEVLFNITSIKTDLFASITASDVKLIADIPGSESYFLLNNISVDKKTISVRIKTAAQNIWYNYKARLQIPLYEKSMTILEFKAEQQSNLSAGLLVQHLTLLKNNACAPSLLMPVPSQKQLEWHKLEMYAFAHFGPNTFNDQEWGNGRPTEARKFQPAKTPKEFTKQWVDELDKLGFKGIMLTMKHHDGFCLWDTQTTKHSVGQNKPYYKYDVSQALYDNLKAKGMKIGLYISPWDRSNWAYGSDYYKEIFKKQVIEQTERFGDIAFELWFDGASGGDSWYGGDTFENLKLRADELTGAGKNGVYEVYDETRNPDSSFPRIAPPNNKEHVSSLTVEAIKIIREKAPHALIFGDATSGDNADGSGVGWIGNEDGWAGRTNWNFWDKQKGRSDRDMYGKEDGAIWFPGEVDMRTREGWFYSARSNSMKKKEELIEFYYRSVGRGANLLINFSPSPTGEIEAGDFLVFSEFKKIIDTDFRNNLLKNSIKIDASNVRGNSIRFSPANLIDGSPDTYWATDDTVTKNAWVSFEFSKNQSFDRLVLREYIALGQRVKKFKIEYSSDGNTWKLLEYPKMPYKIHGDSGDPDTTTTIGYKRILRCYKTRARYMRITFEENRKEVPFAIAEIGVYDSGRKK